MSSVSKASSKGFANASSYDAHRPSYPLSAFSSLLQSLQIEGVNGARVVDLAAGTGKLTELLANRKENFEVVAVEPNDAMRGELDRKNLKGVKVIRGEASKMDLETQSVDAVVVAQVSCYDRRDWKDVYVNKYNTFLVEGISLVGQKPSRILHSHTDKSRFANKESLEEIHRVLVPGGSLGLIWNVEDCLTTWGPPHLASH